MAMIDQRNPLGATDLRLEPIGFGAASFAGGYGDVEQSVADQAVAKAIELGINFFDTAPHYKSESKRSEEILGQALSHIPREKYIINTKCCRYGSEGFDFSAESVRKSVEASLHRLKVAHLDMITVHDIEFAKDINQVINESIPAVRQLQAKGLVRYIGISGYPLDVLLYVAQKTKVDFVLTYCHYNMQNTLLLDYIEDFNKLGVGLINASPLAMGLLSGRPAPSFHPAPKELKDRCLKAAEYCKSKGAEISDLALQFALSSELAKKGVVSTTLVGLQSAKEVEAAIKNYDQTPSAEIIKGVTEILGEWKNYTWPSGERHAEITKKNPQSYQ